MGEPAFVQIGRYRIRRQLAETDFSEVFEAENAAGQLVCLKRLHPRIPAGSEIALSFRREAKLLAAISHRNVVKVIEVGEEDYRSYICLELVKGMSLASLIRESSIDIKDSLEIAIQITEGLQQIHNQGILHRDLKPDNILVEGEPGSRSVKIADLGLAHDRLSDSSGFAGTIAYVAPEQAGLVNWPVDVPSDLYSLGALFYELFTGRPPFHAADSASVLAAHLTKKPEPLSKLQSNVHPLMERIVLKLLAKRPEDRYQTARGLQADLEETQRRLQSANSSSELELDAASSDEVRIGRVFIGRQNELDALKSHLLKAQSGHFTAAFVSGVAGIGKSSLLKEFENQALISGVRFAYGKCHEFARTLPCFGLGEALEDFLHRMEAYPASTRDQIIQRVVDTVGDLGSELVQIAPSYSRFIKNTKPVKYLGEGKDRERFLDLVSRLLKALSLRGAPLVLLIDDLQWADRVVLDVIENLILRQQECAVLLLGTFRSEEVDDDHPLAKILKLEGTGLDVKTIDLDYFDEKETGQLIARSLAQKESAVPEALAEFVYRRTKGTPLFISEVLKAFLAEHVVSVRNTAMMFDIERAERMRLPGTVVDLVLRRLQTMDHRALDLLGRAALLGTDFSFDRISAVADLDSETVYSILQVGIAQQILRLRGAGEYAFYHDRIKEACTHLIQKEHQPSVHRRIIDCLEAGTQTEDLAFELAEHAIRAESSERIVRYCTRAGELAQKRHANDAALRYYSSAVAAVTSASDIPDETRKILKKKSEVLVALGRYKEAREILSDILNQTQADILGEVELLAQIAECLQREGNYAESRDALVRALDRLGRPLYQKHFWLGIFIDRLSILWNRITAGTFSGTKRRPKSAKSTVQVLTRLWMVHVVHDMTPLLHIAYRLLAVATPIGPSEQLAIAHQYLSLTLANRRKPNFNLAIRHAQTAVDLGRKVGAEEVVAGAMVRMAAFNTWRGRSREALVYSERAREMLLAIGNMWDLGNAIIFSYFGKRSLGQLDEALAHAHTLIEIGERTGSSGMQSSGHSKAADILLLKGEVSDGEKHLDAAIEIAESRNLLFDAFQAYKTKGFARLHQQKLTEARVQFQTAIKLLESKGNSFFRAYTTEAYLGWIESIIKDRVYFDKLNSSNQSEIKRIRQTLSQALKTERHFRELGHVFRIVALLAAAEGNIRHARKYFSKALDVFRTQERPLDMALTELDFGQSVASTNQIEAAGYLRRALVKFKQLNTQAFLEQCNQALRSLGEAIESQDQMPSHSADQLAGALLEVSLASASSLAPREQAQAILDKTISLLKADRAFLFTKDDSTGDLDFLLGRDTNGNAIEQAEGYSSTFVKRIASTGSPMIIAGTEEGVLLGAHSAVAHNLLSMIGSPIYMQENLLGVLYLDNRIQQRMYTQEDCDILFAIANHIGVAFHMSRLAIMEVQKKEMEKDLELAGAVQSLLLPKKLEFSAGPLIGHAYYQPATQSGGDWWWYEVRDGQRLTVFLGDVTGHGAGSAMVTAVVTGTISTMLNSRSGPQSVGELLENLNSSLHHLCGGSYWMTMSAVEINLKSLELEAWFAGAPSILVQPAEGDQTWLRQAGTPLGVESPTIRSVKHQLRSGDLVVLYTDGVPEQRCSNGRDLGERRLSKAVSNFKDLPADEFCRSFAEFLNKARGDMPVEDDVSFIALKVNHTPATAEMVEEPERNGI